MSVKIVTVGVEMLFYKYKFTVDHEFDCVSIVI